MAAAEDSIEKVLQKNRATATAIAEIAASPIYSWADVDLAAYGDFLALCQVPDELIPTVKGIKRHPETARQKIAKIDREALALAQAIKNGQITPTQAATAGESLYQQAAEAENLLDHLQRKLAPLHEADKLVNAGLTIDNLITLARQKERNQAQFKKGLTIFRTLAAIKDEQDDTPNLNRMHDLISAYIERINSLPPPDIGGLAARIFEHLRQRMIDAARLLQETIRAIIGQAGDELGEIGAIRNQCAAAAGKNIQDRLAFVERGCSALGKAMNALAGHDEIADLLPAASILTTQLKFFTDCMVGDLCELIAARAVNPSRFAALMGEKFFQGIGGLVRLCRMTLGRLSGNKKIPAPAEISPMLEDLLERCPSIHGESPAAVERLRGVIEETIDNFARPFPHDALLRLAKKTILAYGSACEASFTSIPLPGEIPQVMTAKKRPAELGELVNLFEKGVRALEKEGPAPARRKQG